MQNGGRIGKELGENCERPLLISYTNFVSERTNEAIGGLRFAGPPRATFLIDVRGMQTPANEAPINVGTGRFRN